MEILKFIAFILIFLLTSSIVILAIKSWSFRLKLHIISGERFLKSHRTTQEKFKKAIQEKWNKILSEIESGNERDWRLAIIEADSLIDQCLIHHGHQGNDMAERLKSIHPHELANLDDLWDAHKIRNEIAHNPEFQISQYETKRTIHTYEKVLKEWEVI